MTINVQKQLTCLSVELGTPITFKDYLMVWEMLTVLNIIEYTLRSRFYKIHTQR